VSLGDGARALLRLGRRGPAPGEGRRVLQTAEGPLEAAVFPARGRPRGVILGVHGMSPKGEADPRWVQLARAFAAVGFTVLSPRFPCVAALRMEPAQVHRFGAAIDAAATDPALGAGGAVGLLSVSFSGGLALAAAGARPGRVRAALVIGPYASLPDALANVVVEPGPDPYALHIVLANFVDRVAGPQPGLADALWAAAVDNSAGRGDTARARIEALDPGPRRLGLRLLEDRVARAGFVAALRAEHGPLLAGLDPLPRALDGQGLVVVLHGVDDPVIPAAQGELLAARLRAAGRPVRLLVTPLLSHGDAAGLGPRQAREVARAAAALGAFCGAAAGAPRA
jgi:pimeloyl-ACP methyl ester carboxylesterase